MVDYPPANLDAAYAALSNNIRRAIVTDLVGGDRRVTELARPFDLSLQAVSKHIRVLESAGIVHRRVEGRDHWLSLDPHPGGRLHVTMVGEGRKIEHVGEYLELVPNRRLVFTWQSPYTGPAPSIVTIELESCGAGTDLTLVHEALPADALVSHTGGWGQILDRLATELK